MAERIIFPTGHLASARLEKVLAETRNLGLDWRVVDIGVEVAALMTETIIMPRLPGLVDTPIASWCPAAAGPTSPA